MKIVYIGDLTPGTTSKSRYDAICQLFDFEIIGIDISLPMLNTNRLFRSIGWRFQIGPLISRINRSLEKNISSCYDLIWIDKGNFIRKETLKKLRQRTRQLIHYTPDVAFVRYNSRLFKNNIAFYDICYTTKSFELDLYHKNGCKNVVFCTQGFDASMLSLNVEMHKKHGVVFIGLYEPYREKVIDILVKEGIIVKLGGIGWELYVNKMSKYQNLIYLGSKIFGDNYKQHISSSLFGLGLVSKRFSELHTTRTFEIPACRTILITERNEETMNYYNNDEAIFFDDPCEIPKLISSVKNHEDLCNNGRNRVIKDKRDYLSFMSDQLTKVLKK